MARNFSQNSNRSLRVVGGKMRRPLVSPGLGFYQYKQAARQSAGFESGLQIRLERGQPLYKLLQDPSLSLRFKEFAKSRIFGPHQSKSLLQ